MKKAHKAGLIVFGVLVAATAVQQILPVALVLAVWLASKQAKKTP